MTMKEEEKSNVTSLKLYYNKDVIDKSTSENKIKILLWISFISSMPDKNSAMARTGNIYSKKCLILMKSLIHLFKP